MTVPDVIKLDGSLAEDPAKYILDNYGAALTWDRAEIAEGDQVFRLTAFKEWEGGSATMWAYCYDEEGAPFIGMEMARWWPNADPLPEVFVYDWETTGVIAVVKETGAADWGVGRGEAYFPTTGSGVIQMWVHDEEIPSDRIRNSGWLDGTPYRQLCPIFELTTAAEEPEEQKGSLERIADALELLVDIVDSRL